MYEKGKLLGSIQDIDYLSNVDVHIWMNTNRGPKVELGWDDIGPEDDPRTSIGLNYNELVSLRNTLNKAIEMMELKRRAV
jgi:hypothetical protein